MQTFNPYLPSWEYIPDGEPYVFNGRAYVYGSHDRFNSRAYCMNDYVTWSAPVDSADNAGGIGPWRYEGIIYRAKQDPRADKDSLLFAPDLQQGADGRFYLYYALHNRPVMGIAVADSPAGPFEYYGVVEYPDGVAVGEAPNRKEDFSNFDPGVLVDDDGKVYLYSGFAPRKTARALSVEEAGYEKNHLGAYCMELEADMMTVKRGPFLVFPRAGDDRGALGKGYRGHEFFEASSLRKVKLPGWESAKYYFIYSSINSHELCYALSDKPDGGFVYGGVIISNGDVRPDKNNPEIDINVHGIKMDDTEASAYMGNNHGSMAEINGSWYIFYHRQTNLHQYSRQDCAEPITINNDGSIEQVEMTSCGLNTDKDGKPSPLNGWGTYEARIACNLFMPGTVMWFPFDHRLEPGNIPYITQDAPDYTPPVPSTSGEGRLGGTTTDLPNTPQQYIANFQNDAVAGFKYFMVDNAAHPLKTLTMRIRGKARGTVFVSGSLKTEPFAKLAIDVDSGNDASAWKDCAAACAIPEGKTALFFTFQGEGAFDWLSFTLS
ncbi:MAG: family 43 glycosylhydrolase [Spirochaetaceae bacterium]|jgi:hypothetical protein|nr:family 43 glycosylhydrolase [Spirochaetaceae bacterium]